MCHAQSASHNAVPLRSHLALFNFIFFKKSFIAYWMCRMERKYKGLSQEVFPGQWVSLIVAEENKGELWELIANGASALRSSIPLSGWLCTRLGCVHAKCCITLYLAAMDGRLCTKYKSCEKWKQRSQIDKICQIFFFKFKSQIIFLFLILFFMVCIIQLYQEERNDTVNKYLIAAVNSCEYITNESKCVAHLEFGNRSPKFGMGNCTLQDFPCLV